MRTRPRATPPIAALLAACTASIASAQTTTWTNPNGGLWHDPANWSDGVPDGSARAQFVAPLLGEVRLSGSSSCLGLDVRSPTASLDLAGNWLQIPWSLELRELRLGAPSQQTEVRLRNGRVGGLAGVSMRVGTNPASDVDLILDGVWLEVSETWVGGEGRARLRIEGAGASVSYGGAGIAVTHIATDSEVHVLGSQWNAQRLVSRGLIEVANGGSLVCDPSSQFSPSSVLRVLGAGSRASGVAYWSQGLLEVAEGARIEGEFRVHVGELRLSGVGSVVETGGVSVSRLARVLDHASLLAPDYLSGPFEIAAGATVQSRGGTCSLVIRDDALVAGPESFYLIGVPSYPSLSSVSSGGMLTFGQARVWGASLEVLSGGRVQGLHASFGGSAAGLPQGEDSSAPPYSTLSFDDTISGDIGTLSLLRGSSIGLFTAAGSMTGSISLDGIIRPSGFLLDGSITASPTGLVEVSLDAAAPAITATGTCNLAAGLTVITREGPVAAGQSWTVVEAGSFSLGAIALPSLGPGLEWALNNSATSLSLAATAVQVRCRPSVDRLSAAVVDGYVGDPIVLAAAVSGPVSDVRWHKDGLPLTDGGIYSGAATPMLAIASHAPVNLARYHLIATGPCGKTASLPVDASIRCGGDFNQDFSIDGDDVIDFFGPWDAGEIEADWNHDGAVDGDDVIGFFAKWDGGC